MGTSGSRRADPGAKRGKYVLAFVDDGDNTHEVDAKDVVPVCQLLVMSVIWADGSVPSLGLPISWCFVSDHLGPHVFHDFGPPSFQGKRKRQILQVLSRPLCSTHSSSLLLPAPSFLLFLPRHTVSHNTLSPDPSSSTTTQITRWHS